MLLSLNRAAQLNQSSLIVFFFCNLLNVIKIIEKYTKIDSKHIKSVIVRFNLAAPKVRFSIY
jgi:5-bromo-4-chloroindolyl phosphate hydrolysis protein